MATAAHLLLLGLVALTAAAAVSAHNITEVLSSTEYTEFNKYLSETKLADEINSRTTVTVLALTNSDMEDITTHPLSVIKNVLSLHIVLDYYDPKKLHKLPESSTLSTTLYQTTGNAPGNLGFINITDLGNGKVGFGSAAPGSKLDSTYTKSVNQIPYTLSVVEISDPIIAPGILTAPAPSAAGLNITGLLVKAGCKTFADLISTTGVVKTFQSAVEKGLTIFAPTDEGFKDEELPDLTKLTSAEMVTLLLYHSFGYYTPKGTLKTTESTARLTTLATSGAGAYDLSVTHAGDDITLHTGVNPSRVADTVIDAPPCVIFTVDSVFLPEELFGKAPAPAPSLEPVAPPTPEPALAPSPALPPSPVADSPPAPPSDSPADSPSAESENSTSPNGAGDYSSVPKLMAATMTMMAVLLLLL